MRRSDWLTFSAVILIIATSLGAISAIFVMPYYPVWSLLYIIIALMVVYGLVAGYGGKTEKAA
jgi:uncharacterized RDD family membrane protein YckC